MDITQFIVINGITTQVARADQNPNMDDSADMDHWRVTLQRPGKRMTVYFSKGRGHNGKPPQADEVLDCLASDAASVENAQDFADWCGDYGYDTDSRKAHRTYTICKRQAERLRKFVGATNFKELLFNTERL